MSNMFHHFYRIFVLVLCLSVILPAQAFSIINSLMHRTNDPIAGNPRGKITIVEFFDYQCSHCINMAPVIHDIIKDNKDVRIVFKEFPIRGPLSEYASLAALAANKQGKYVDFNYALFLNQPLSEENILTIANNIGLNITQLKRDMTDKTIKNQLQNNIHLAQSLRLTGTPAFYIGKTDANDEKELQLILGSTRQSELQATIDKVRKTI